VKDLTARLTGTSERRSIEEGTVHHPGTCGPCDDCREALADYATIPAYKRQGPPLPALPDKCSTCGARYYKGEKEALREHILLCGSWMKRLAALERDRKPVDAGKSMRHACGRLAGEFAETFWQNRERARAVAPPEQSTLDQLIRHADRFGCELVYDTAVGCGLSDDELLTLGLELRKIADRTRRSASRRTGGRMWRPPHLPEISEEGKGDRLVEQSRVRDLQEKNRKRSRRRSGVEVDVLAAYEENPLLLPSVIADRCNVSERRVKKILLQAAP
jgi:hypothetical protein